MKCLKNEIYFIVFFPLKNTTPQKKDQSQIIDFELLNLLTAIISSHQRLHPCATPKQLQRMTSRTSETSGGNQRKPLKG